MSCDPTKKPNELGDSIPDDAGVDKSAPLWKWLGKPQPTEKPEPSQPPRPRSLAEAIAMDKKARATTKPAIRNKFVVYGVTIFISVAVGLFVISRTMLFFAENGDGGPLPQTKKMLDDIEEAHQARADQEEILEAVRAFAGGNISDARFRLIERKVEARAAARHDLKQAQDDFDAGHISIGELHRIQREVRDRLEWANAP